MNSLLAALFVKADCGVVLNTCVDDFGNLVYINRGQA